MARSARRSRRAPSSSLIQIIRETPPSTVEGVAFVVLGLAAGLGLGLSQGAREWVVETLGYGWIPAGIWLASTLAALRYHHRSLRVNWRWWMLAAGAATTLIGALSLIHPGDGILAETSLSGRWGGVVGGAPVGLAAAKLIAITLLTPLLLFPRSVGPVFLRGLRYLGLGIYFVPVYVYLGFYHGYLFLDRLLRSLLNPHSRQRWIDHTRAALVRRMPSEMSSRWNSSEDATSAVHPTSESEEGASLWANMDPGTIPSWSPADDPIPRNGGGESDKKPGYGPVSKWKLPAVGLLAPPETRKDSEAPLEQMARHIESTLSDHGVAVEVKDIKAGPRIVRFGLVPGWQARKGEATRGDDGASNLDRSRVKVQSILMREKDLALALQTPYLRIEAPVPGEALVGLEVPSPAPSKVHLREVMGTPTFGLLAAKEGLPVAIGQDTGGSPVVMDLTTLPHMLIAGATGSGKSVCINSIIATLLLAKPPDQLRFLMVDPKRVELTPFNGIPHLIAPVIVDVDEVNTALRSLMREMLRRYKRMEDMGVRNITNYNNKAPDRLPYIVLVVDELADLMIAGGFEVEQNLVRLAQLGRATGIHLVLATQRPSVNVVTGLLKANIPARIAFAVASQIDSRVILDTIGAEKLLGKGDMLLLHNESPKPRRVQGTLVYDEEVDRLVSHWTSQKGPPLPVIPMGDVGEADTDDQDIDEGLMDQARDLAIRTPNLSLSLLERRLKIGGWRASQVMELLEDEGLAVSR